VSSAELLPSSSSGSGAKTDIFLLYTSAGAGLTWMTFWE
jgi:hypothetical protein